MTKRTRKIKPYPAIVPDDVKPAEKFPALWSDYLALAVMIFLCMCFLLLAGGVAGYVWGMIR
jgi:hypothetical protein